MCSDDTVAPSDAAVGSKRATIRLDATDRTILQMMQSDASRTLGDMAQAIGISQAQCWRKIDRLRKFGVIQKTVAQLNRYKMGFLVEAFVQVAITTIGGNNHQKFYASMQTAPEVVECYLTSGEYNFLLRVLARDLTSYGQFMEERILSQPGIARISAAISTSRFKDVGQLPVS